MYRARRFEERLAYLEDLQWAAVELRPYPTPGYMGRYGAGVTVRGRKATRSVRHANHRYPLAGQIRQSVGRDQLDLVEG